MMALAGVEPETLVSEPDALTTRPPLTRDSSCHILGIGQLLSRLTWEIPGLPCPLAF